MNENYLLVIHLSINSLTSPEEGATIFTSPYLSAGALEQGEVKDNKKLNNFFKICLCSSNTKNSVIISLHICLLSIFLYFYFYINQSFTFPLNLI